MQLLRIHYQKLFVCLSFVMLVFVVVRVWDSDSDPIAQRQNGSGSLRTSEKRQSSGHENSINIDSPALSLHPLRTGNKEGNLNVFADLFQELAKVGCGHFYLDPNWIQGCITFNVGLVIQGNFMSYTGWYLENVGFWVWKLKEVMAEVIIVKEIVTISEKIRYGELYMH